MPELNVEHHVDSDIPRDERAWCVGLGFGDRAELVAPGRSHRKIAYSDGGGGLDGRSEGECSMRVTDTVSFAGNTVAFLALVYKTYYDLVRNPKLFHRQKGPLGELEAARKKRDRSTMITFLLLAISSALTLIDLIEWG